MLIVSLLICVKPCIADNFFIGAGFKTPLYYGFDNPVVAYTYAYPNSSTFIVVTNGTATKGADSLFLVRPDSLKDITIYLKVKRSNDTITLGQKQFHVIKPPEPLVKIGGKLTGTKFESFMLLIQLGLSTISGHDAENNRYNIVSFTMTILKASGGYIRVSTNEGWEFTPEMKALIEKTGSGDIVMFTNIKAAIKGIKNHLFDLAAVEVSII